MNRKKNLVLLAFILALLIPASAALAAYSRTFTLKADVTLEIPEPTAEPTPTPTQEPTPTPDPANQVKIVYHAGYNNDSITEYAQRRSTVTLEGELFTRSLYKQVGWSTWPYSNYVEYEFGDSFRTGTSTEHFYAVWEYDWGWFDPWPWGWYGSSMSYGTFDSALPEEATVSPAEDTPALSDGTPSPAADTPSPADDTPSPAAGTPSSANDTPSTGEEG